MRADECFATGCRSRKCYLRIYTKDGRFDHVACRDHQEDLERHADAVLGSQLRSHVLSSQKLHRWAREIDL